MQVFLGEKKDKYVGLQKKRVDDAGYWEFLEEFMQAVVNVFGQTTLIQVCWLWNYKFSRIPDVSSSRRSKPRRNRWNMYKMFHMFEKMSLIKCCLLHSLKTSTTLKPIRCWRSMRKITPSSTTISRGQPLSPWPAYCRRLGSGIRILTTLEFCSQELAQ